MTCGEPEKYVAGWEIDKTHPGVPRIAQKAYFKKAYFHWGPYKVEIAATESKIKNRRPKY